MSDRSFQKAREVALERYGYECPFTGITEQEHKEKYDRGLDVHHIVPRSAGGSNNPSNLIPVSIECHKTLEHSQANAFKEVAEKIRSDNDQTDEPEDDGKGPVARESEKVIEGEFWEHDDYGRIHIREVQSEQIGFGNSGPIHQTKVVFQTTDADVKYTESYEVLLKRANREAHQYESDAVRGLVDD